jgi:hypothetical protein
VVAAMAERESRLSRWSRLKSKGGADVREEKQVLEDKARAEAAEAETEDPFKTLPGGTRVRHFVPAMAPLAPDPEDDDDRLTRGIGHAEPEAEDGARPQDIPLHMEGVMTAEPALAEGDSEEDLFAGIDETELSEEEREIVAGLPPLDTLDKDSDFTPFLRNGVPEFLKRRALRVLWRVNPFFNFRDGLNEYDEDYNVIHKIIDSTFGSYKVGRGHLSEQELQDMMPEKARRAFDDDPEEDVESRDAGETETSDATADESREDTDSSRKTAHEGPAESPLNDAETDEDIGDGEDDPDA